MKRNETLNIDGVIELERNTLSSHKKGNGLVALTCSFLVIACLASCEKTTELVVETDEGIVYSINNADLLEDDIDSIYSEYESQVANRTFDPTKNDFTPSELALIALHKYEQCENSYSVVYGLTNAAFGVKQYTNVFNIKSGEDFFNEALSTSSVVQQAHRFYQEDGSVKEYVGKIKNKELTATYDEESYDVYTLDEFEKYYGKQFSRASIYIVSTKTILEETKTITSDGNIKVSFDLDPELGVIRYVLQMCVNGGLQNIPEFIDSHVSFTFTPDMDLICLDVYENYNVNLGIDWKSEGFVHESYYPNETIEIPSLDESLESYYTEVEFDEN